MESSSVELKLAAFEGGQCLAEKRVQAALRQNESLAPLFRSLLGELGWEAGQIAAVAISLGPGSFTGLRSGLAFAKGLAYASGAMLIGVPTMEAWAQASGAEEALVWLDARRGMVYRGAYRRGKALLPEAMISLEEAKAEDFPSCKHVGDLQGLGGLCSAEAVGQLALRRLAKDEADEPASLEPIYLRRPEAELLWEKRHGV
jgi:tRNA threonylcarbamoyladenosine biosynthesis protein TsaB